MAWSFLTSLLPPLPSLPSLPALPALPQSVQRRLLSFLLRKAVGQFVHHGIDSDTIESDLGNGHVKAQDLKLSPDAINALLEGLPIEFVSGTVGSVEVDVSWPLSLASTISVKVDTVSIKLRVCSLNHLQASAVLEQQNLSESVLSLSVASEFVAQEVSTDHENALKQSLLGESTAAAGFDVPGAFQQQRRHDIGTDDGDADRVEEVTMLAGMIDRLLSRLRVDFRNLQIQLEFGHDCTQSLDVAVHYLQYAAPEEVQRSPATTIRTITISPPSIYLVTPFAPETAPSPRNEQAALDSESDADSDENVSPEGEMLMSQSIADLRDSFASAQSCSSIYESAIGRPQAHVATTLLSKSAQRDEDSPFMDSAAATAEGTNTKACLMSFGSEAITVELSKVVQTSSRSTLAVDVKLGVLSLLLQPYQLDPLVDLAMALTPKHAGERTMNSPAAVERTSNSVLAVNVSVKAAQILIVSDLDSDTVVSDKDPFWHQPLAHAPEQDHVRARLDDIRLHLDCAPHKPISTAVHVVQLNVSESIVMNNLRGYLPILLSDPNMAQQYDEKHYMPKFEYSDWIQAFPDTRNWKTRIKTKARTASMARDIPDSPSPVAFAALKNSGGVDVQTCPIHLFVDLSTVTRLNKLVSRLLKCSSRLQDLDDGAVTPRGEAKESPSTPTRMFKEPSFEPDTETEPSPSWRMKMLRISIRCAPPSKLGAADRNISMHLRSGIAVIDCQNIALRQTKCNETRLEGDRVLLAFASVNATQAQTVFAMSTLDLDDAGPSAIRPSVTILSSQPAGAATTTSTIEANVPLARCNLDKPNFDSLQLFADDVSQWTSRTFGGSERSFLGSDMREESKLIGSRYFGAKSFARPGRQGSGSDSLIASQPSTIIKLVMTDGILDVFFGQQQEAPRHLRAKIQDVSVQADLLTEGKTTLRLEAAVGDLSLAEIRPQEQSKALLSRHFPATIHGTQCPVLRVGFTSLCEPDTGIKETRVQVKLSNLLYHLLPDLTYIDDLFRFSKAPSGVFEQVVPSELTRLRITISDAAVHITAPRTESQIVSCISLAQMSADLMPDNLRTVFDVTAEAFLLAVDSAEDLIEPDQQCLSILELWQARGFKLIASVDDIELEVKQGNGSVLPDFELLAKSGRIELMLCADTIASMTAFASEFSAGVNLGAVSRNMPLTMPVSSRLQQSVEMFASVDQSAFGALPLVEAPFDLIDDVPYNIDYINNLQRPIRGGSTLAERPSLARRGEGVVISDIDDETITMMTPAGLQIVEDYLAVPRMQEEQSVRSAPGVVRCRVDDLDLDINLYEGYDWHRTRKAIENRAKIVRRRLEKIRQLLASGQKADASGEDASVLMFESVQLGLPPGASELPLAQLMAAIDQELESDAGATTTSTTSEGESPPVRQSTSAPAATETRTRSVSARVGGRSRKRLTRSRDYAIQITCQAVQAIFDIFPPNSDCASQLRADVDLFEIIDNVATSTWNKFLTEMRPHDGGVVRPTGTPMLRVEQRNLRSSAKEEIALKIKISPLRLYIDQDALDFLKAFGAFKLPVVETTAVPTSSEEPFFQRVEILPIKIKLDYKPKRVDLRALRQGRSAELMNFFHFDGSEMTLRHLVVTGVSGSTRLSELVQEIWTPDVKANQLADVISGIAPVRSVVNVGSGLANLVLLPIEQYRKDGRIVRGLQKGASSFAKQTTLEALNVGARLATGTQVILEQAESVLGAGKFDRSIATETMTTASNVEGDLLELSQQDIRELTSRYAQQPQDLRQGVESAYQSLGSNLRSAAQTILAVPMEVYERSGTEGPVRAVVRAVPIAVLKPMIGATEAVSKTLFGLRNSLDEDAGADSSDKYKRASS
ncbi:autophagy- protein 2 [Microbotryomycetes sp. JL201]|nr:autophagy- protein 2 [Microbotryomycetes sp. JL201]